MKYTPAKLPVITTLN